MSGANPLPKHLRKDQFSSDKIVVDTSVFIAGLITTEQVYRHQAAVRFFQRLLDESVNVVVSQVIYPEFWNVCMAMELSRALGKEANFHKVIKDNPKVLDPHMSEIQANMRKLFELRGKFGDRWIPIGISENITQTALEIQTKYRLDIHDAIHVATATYGQLTDIATFDNDIKGAGIPNLNIWYQFDQSGLPAGESVAEMPAKPYQPPRPS